MSNELLHKLEEKIDNAIEAIELYCLQIEELEDQNANLQNEVDALLEKQKTWENNLTTMLNKLEGVEVSKQNNSKQANHAQHSAEEIDQNVTA